MSDERFDFLEIGDQPARPAGDGAAPIAACSFHPVEIIGGPGTDLGQFNQPNGIAADQYGNLYVADTNNNRIQKITPDGEVYGFGVQGSGWGQLFAPIDVAVDPLLHLYVLEYGNERIQRFSPVGEPLACFAMPGDQVGCLREARAFCLDKFNRIYVADTGNDRVQVFDARGKFLDIVGGVLTEGAVARPQAVAIDRDHNVWVADGLNHRLVAFNSEGGRIGAIGREGSAPGELSDPTCLVIAPDDTLLVAENGNGRISALRTDGTCLGTYGGADAAARVAAPRGLALTTDGHLYVSDAVHHRVLKLEFGSPQR